MKCFYWCRSGHLARDCYKKKSDEAGHKKHIIHSGHFVGEGLNSDLKNIKLFMSNVALTAKTKDFNALFVDSGALIHMKWSKKLYENFKEITNGGNIYLGDDHAHHMKEYCDIPMTLPNGSVRRIHNVVYVSRIKKFFIFVYTITNQNLKVEFLKTKCIVKVFLDHCKPVTSGVRVGGMYKLNVTCNINQELTSTTMSTKILCH